MATGGTFTSYNKIRAGAYMNFNVAPAQAITTGVRGVVAAAIPMSWGPEGEIIKVTGEDFAAGRSTAKLGFTYSSEDARMVRLLLTGAQTALLWRLDTGGATASTTFTVDDGEGGQTPAYTVTALYPGAAGNDIIFTIQERVSRPGDFEARVTFRGVLVENTIVRTLEDLINLDSAWVTVVPDDSLTAVVEAAGIVLGDTTQGTNGTVDTSDLSGFFEALQYESFNTVVVYDEEPTFNDVLADQVRSWSEGEGKWCRAVLLTETNTYDYRSFIALRPQGYAVGEVTDSDYYEVTPGLSALLIAGLDAGCALNSSLTSYEIVGATSILTPRSNSQIEADYEDGFMVLSYRQDKAVVIEYDISSKYTFADPNEEVLQLNQINRTCDYILNTVPLIFNRNFCGKVQNNAAGRGAFKAEIINVMLELQEQGAIRDFNPSQDVRVYQGEKITDVIVEIDVWPVSAMTKMYGYLTVYLDDRAAA